MKLAVLGAMIAGGAMAQPVSGLYVGGGIGYNNRPDFTSTFTGPVVFPGFPPNFARTTSRLGHGLAMTGTVGWSFGNGMRAELEGSYRTNPGLQNSNTRNTDFRQYGLLINALYDIEMASFTLGRVRATPYVGVGAGYVWSSVGRVGGGGSFNVAGRFGYQGMLGVAWGLDSVLPGLALTTEYRYTRSLATVLIRNDGGNARYVNENHSLLAGIRYSFNTPRFR